VTGFGAGSSRGRIERADTYNALKDKSLREIYTHGNWPHHSKEGNEVVADLIARKISGKI